MAPKTFPILATLGVLALSKDTSNLRGSSKSHGTDQATTTVALRDFHTNLQQVANANTGQELLPIDRNKELACAGDESVYTKTRNET